MIKLSDVINCENKLFESYPIMFIDTNEHDKKVSYKTFEKILLELQRIQDSEFSNLFYQDDLRDVRMFFSKVLTENKLSLDERLKILKSTNIELYDDIISNLNNELYLQMINHDVDGRMHSILTSYNIPCFRNSI